MLTPGAMSILQQRMGTGGPMLNAVAIGAGNMLPGPQWGNGLMKPPGGPRRIQPPIQADDADPMGGLFRYARTFNPSGSMDMIPALISPGEKIVPAPSGMGDGGRTFFDPAGVLHAQGGYEPPGTLPGNIGRPAPSPTPTVTLAQLRALMSGGGIGLPTNPGPPNWRLFGGGGDPFVDVSQSGGPEAIGGGPSIEITSDRPPGIDYGGPIPPDVPEVADETQVERGLPAPAAGGSMGAGTVLGRGGLSIAQQRANLAALAAIGHNPLTYSMSYLNSAMPALVPGMMSQQARGLGQMFAAGGFGGTVTGSMGGLMGSKTGAATSERGVGIGDDAPGPGEPGYRAPGPAAVRLDTGHWVHTRGNNPGPGGAGYTMHKTWQPDYAPAGSPEALAAQARRRNPSGWLGQRG